MTDLEYTKGKMFTRFMPNTPAGETVWRELAKNDGVAAVLNFEADSVLRQIRSAGYTVKKAGKPDMTVDEILKELEL